MIYLKPGELRCWSCEEWMSFNEFSHADGLCPYCDVEIDTKEVPYVTESEEPTNDQWPAYDLRDAGTD